MKIKTQEQIKIHLEYLKVTLIPDLKTSGHEETAKDLETCFEIIDQLQLQSENDITLSNKKSEELFYNSLCNALGSGYMNAYGVELDYDDKDYAQAKKNWKASRPKENAPCAEDIWMQILLDGKTLILTDVENDGDMTRSITLKDVHERVSNTPIEHLCDALSENDDATTADIIIQTVFYEEVVFG